MNDYEIEKKFWEENPVDRFDLETDEEGVVVGKVTPSPVYGDWVRAQDYRRVVEGLRQEIDGLRHNWQTAAEAGLALVEQVESLRGSLEASRGGDPTRCPACYASTGHHYGWCRLAEALALIGRCVRSLVSPATNGIGDDSLLHDSQEFMKSPLTRKM